MGHRTVYRDAGTCGWLGAGWRCGAALPGRVHRLLSKATCNEAGAFFALSITWPTTLAILVVGVVAAIILLALRRRAWWVALATLILVSAGGILGVLLYIGNVGGFTS